MLWCGVLWSSAGCCLVKRIKKGENKKKRKSSSKGGNIPTQKNKITNFFKIIQTKETGLGALGGVEKREGGGSNRISDLHFHNEHKPCTAADNDQMDLVDFYCSTDEELQLEMHID